VLGGLVDGIATGAAGLGATGITNQIAAIITTSSTMPAAITPSTINTTGCFLRSGVAYEIGCWSAATINLCPRPEPPMS
jgi:hypothetical protein